jgi:hypothetical protein
MYRQMIIKGEEGRIWEAADCFIRRDSSVSVVTDLLDGWQRNLFRFPGDFLFPKHPYLLWGPLSLSGDYRASFSVGAGGISLGVNLTHHFRLVSMLRMRGGIFMHPAPMCLHGMMPN